MIDRTRVEAFGDAAGDRASLPRHRGADSVISSNEFSDVPWLGRSLPATTCGRFDYRHNMRENAC